MKWDQTLMCILWMGRAFPVFQVNETLKSHHIQPHWMFALDTLLRGAVQAAINILEPGQYNNYNHLRSVDTL